MSDQNQGHNSPLVIIGIALLAVGVWLMSVRLGLVPSFVQDIWNGLRRADDAIALILVGAVFIMLARSRGTAHMPAKGARLYKSRSDKWVSGVLGGLAQYFGVDATVVRLAYLALGLAVNPWTAFVVYVVLAIVVPDEPKDAAQTPPPVA